MINQETYFARSSGKTLLFPVLFLYYFVKIQAAIINNIKLQINKKFLLPKTFKSLSFTSILTQQNITCFI